MSPARQDKDAVENARSPLGRAWRSGLLLGFVVLLLLILFVTGIGYTQIQAAHARLHYITDQHMKKLELTKIMHLSARNRTLLLQRVMLQRDPFARDESRMAFEASGADFVRARLALLGLGLSPQERALLDDLRAAVQRAQPILQEIIELAYADWLEEAGHRLVEQAIPAQDTILSVLSGLDRMTREAAQQAARQADREYTQALHSMLGLSAAALTVGLLVAILVIRRASEASRIREHLATHDLLTGLPNRLLLKDRLDQALAHARRERRKLGVMFIDLDGFKRINDSLGHAAGDALIRAVAGRIRAGIRAEDTVARVGGDEFVVIGGGAQTVDDLIHIAENLIATLGRPFELCGRQTYVGCSIGISVYPEDGDTAQTLIEHADVAMYHAKEAGRGCYRLFDPAMNSRVGEQLELETAMRQGLERDEFVLHYQPQIDWSSGIVCGVEALVRWNHPQRGLVPPSEFLPLAEKSDLILQLGRRSLEMACKQAIDWDVQGCNGLKVAVNLSRREFWRGDIVGLVRETLEKTGMPAQRLQIELTEGILMENVDLAAERVWELKALDVMIAVDDFGTGYSSLAHLKRFPIDVLKIDRYFVKDIEQQATDRAIVRAILALADSLGLEVVAEGVENEAQIALLRKLGCTRFQGYHVSRPLPADQVLSWLQVRGQILKPETRNLKPDTRHSLCQ